MKRKLFCLLLCLFMVLPTVMMASCSSEDDTEVTTATSTSSVKAMTLVLYTIAGEGTTEEAIAGTQAALNTITEAKFNTHIILRALSEDEYYTVIEQKLEAIEAQKALEEAEAASRKAAQKAAKAAGVTTTPITTSEDTTVETDETMLDQYGLEKTVYPEENGDQLDIFLITNLDKYKEYFDRGVLLQLDEELSVNSKILKDYIYPTFLSAMKLGGGTYAIPNNHMVGEYEYMLINRELFDKYYFDIDSITIVNDLAEYITDVGENEAGITPVVDTYGVESFMYYPTGTESVFGGYSAGKLAAGASATPKNIFTMRGYKNTEAYLYNWNKAGYISTDSSIVDTGKFGVAFIKGDYTIPEQYKDDYYVVTYKYPTFDNSNAYSSMYAVGAYTKSVSRCMEVITYMTINEEFRNIFQYGVENVNYEVDEYTGTVNILNNDYNMNPLYTGNMFKLWQNDAMTDKELELSADSWAIAKLQNADTSVSPYLGFTITDEPEEVEEKEAAAEQDAAAAEGDAAETETLVVMTVQEILAGLEQVSEEYLTKLNNFTPGMYPIESTDENGDPITEETEILEIADYISYLSDQLDKNEFIIQATYADNAYSPLSQYNTWYSAMYPSAAE